MISLIGNTVVRVLLYILWTATLQFPLIAHYLYMSVVHLPKQYVFFEDCGQWVSSCWKTQLYFSFLCTYIHLQAMQNSGKLIDEEGHQFHVSADTCTCKPVVKQISSQDHTSCQWVFGTTSTDTTFLETGAWNLVWKRCRKLIHYVATYIKCTTFVPAA